MEILPAAVLDGRMPTRRRTSETQSLYDYLEKNHGIRIFQGTAVLRPIPAPKDVAEKLQVHRNDILLLISQTDYDENHRPIIYSDEYHLSRQNHLSDPSKGPPSLSRHRNSSMLSLRGCERSGKEEPEDIEYGATARKHGSFADLFS